MNKIYGVEIGKEYFVVTIEKCQYKTKLKDKFIKRNIREFIQKMKIRRKK